MKGSSWVIVVVLLAGCDQPERTFDNPLVEDEDGDGVAIGFDCDDTDPFVKGLCDYGAPCTMSTQCATELCRAGTCQCANAWQGNQCDVCPENWAGNTCDHCADAYAGAMCDLFVVEVETFVMGSPEDEPGRDTDELQHDVTLTRNYAIGSVEVTQAQWTTVMGSNPSEFSSCGEDCPVEQVNWWSVLSFLNARSQAHGLDPCFDLSECSVVGGEFNCSGVTIGLNSEDDTIYGCSGYRLPTEAEWEYAYRAGTTTALYNGSILDLECADSKVDAIAWYCGNATESTHPVGEKTPNAWGLHDMGGNVGEWTWDCVLEAPDSGVGLVDPIGPIDSCAGVRGGNWLYPSFRARAADRFFKPQATTDSTVGFRIALTTGPAATETPGD